MRIISLSSVLTAACTLAPVTLVQAQAPCGVVTESTALSANCYGTLTVAADNITVDLNGHTLFGNLGSVERPAVEIKNRRGVTLKNGTVISSPGAGGGVLISGGSSNVLSDLTLNAGENVKSVVMVNGTRNTLTRLAVNVLYLGGGVVLGGSRNTLSDSVINAKLYPRSVLDVQGTSNAVLRNSIDSENVAFQLPLTSNVGAVTVRGDGHLLEDNRVTNFTPAGSPTLVFNRPAVTLLPDTRQVTIRRNALDNESFYNRNEATLKVSGAGHSIVENRMPHSIGLHLVAAERIIAEKNIFIDNEVALRIEGGTGNRIAYNECLSDTFRGIEVNSDGNTISKNRVDLRVNGAEGGIIVNGLKNIIKSNIILHGEGNIDLIDFTGACGTNKWSRNTFVTDNEGDGPDAGCIQ